MVLDYNLATQIGQEVAPTNPLGSMVLGKSFGCRSVSFPGAGFHSKVTERMSRNLGETGDLGQQILCSRMMTL